MFIDRLSLGIGETEEFKPVQEAPAITHNRANAEHFGRTGQTELKRDDFALYAFGCEDGSHAAAADITATAHQILVSAFPEHGGLEQEVCAISFVAPLPPALFGSKRFFEGRRSHERPRFRNGKGFCTQPVFGVYEPRTFSISTLCY